MITLEQLKRWQIDNVVSMFRIGMSEELIRQTLLGPDADEFFRAAKQKYETSQVSPADQAETSAETPKADVDLEAGMPQVTGATEIAIGGTPQGQQIQTDPLPSVPAELKQKQNWVLWKLETVDERLTKVPYSVGRGKAASNNPATWTTYEAAVTGATIDAQGGVGIMTDGSFIGWDLDGCRNPQTGEITPWAQSIIDALRVYTEITPSGFGVRAYSSGKLPDGPRRFSMALSAGFGDKVGIEVYDHARYFTVTGTRLGDAATLTSPNVPQAYELCRAIGKQFPSEKRSKASSDSSNCDVQYQVKLSGTTVTSKLALLLYGEIVSRSPFILQDTAGNSIEYPSQSEADLSLATLLAMKHNGDADLIDSDFRESSLYRQKWEREDYRGGTIQKAIASANSAAEKAAQQAQTAATTQDDEPEETFDDDKQETFPECPIFTGVLTDLSRALYPSLPLEFKQWGFITRWGLLRSGLDTLQMEKHLQPRFDTALVCYPNRGKTACNNETREAMDLIYKMAVTHVATANNSQPTTRNFGNFDHRDSVDSGPALVELFYNLAKDAEKDTSTTDKAARVMLEPDELSELFEKARSSGTRVSTMFHQLLKLHSGNRTGNTTKADGDHNVENAHLAILGGATVDTYKHNLWTGTGGGRDGLQSRFIIITTNAPRVPPIPLLSDGVAAFKAEQRLAKLLQMPGRQIAVSDDAAKMLDTWWYSFDNSKKSAARILETVKQLLIVLAVTNADDAELWVGEGLTVGIDLMRQAIAFGDYEVAVREQLNPPDASSVVQAMENAILAWAKKHASKKSQAKTRNECRRVVSPHRMSGGVGTFNLAWDNIIKGGYLKLREKGQREGRYSL